MSTVLPRIFALFDDDPAWRENFCRERFCLMRRVSAPVEPLRLEPYSPPEELRSRITFEANRLDVQPVSIEYSGSETFWWHTGFSLFYGNSESGIERQPIPVVDFLHRSRLPAVYTLTAENDDDICCMVRQIDQRCIRSRIEKEHTQIHVQPIREPTTSIPKFVLEAYMRDAIAQGQTCPITCKEISECESVSIPDCCHWFDTEALATWLKTKKTCPVCKEAISGSIQFRPVRI